MPATWSGRWAGGRIRVTDGGKRVWMIERSIAGRRYAISLQVATERDAHAELALFTRDPAAYASALRGAAPSGPEPLHITGPLVDRFVEWARAPEQELNAKYVEHILHNYLHQWVPKLEDRDFRRIPTPELRQMLGSWSTAKKHRVIALKAMTAWLRDEAGLLTSRDDPTLDLKTVKGKRKRGEDESKVHEIGHVVAVYRAAVLQAVRDQIRLCFSYGVHFSELERFAQGVGRLRDVGPWPGCPVVATLRVRHKRKEWHTISLDAAGAAAARRIQAGGWKSHSAAYQHLLELSQENNLPHIHLGWGRHSFVTWCRTPGLGVIKHEPPKPAISLEDVAVVTGHTNLETPRFHYDEADHIPHLLELPLRLVHPDDPPVDQVVRLAPRSSARNRKS